ncbi:sigma-70 family RNA polymerase sigma factor [bacterium]|nr:sigma-70 family RNA polymerase sigma factor [bacterium]
MPLTEIDRQLIHRCLEREPEAWCEFVDRYLGVVFQVIQHTSHMRGMVLHGDDAEDLAADVLSTIVDNNFKVLRRFRGKSSMASYLAVIARRVVVNKLSRRAIYEKKVQGIKAEQEAKGNPPHLDLERKEEVIRLLDTLDGTDADLVRAFYLEHKTYSEISRDLGIPENSIGPTLNRLREQLRKSASF